MINNYKPDATAIIHIASPVNVFLAEPSSFMKASVEGLRRALEAADLHRATVKSFVFMSSVASIFSEKGGEYTFTEADWNTYAEPMVEKQGKDAPKHVIYEASKVAAERELWKFWKEKFEGKGISATAVNPMYVSSLFPPSPRHVFPMASRF